MEVLEMSKATGRSFFLDTKQQSIRRGVQQSTPLLINFLLSNQDRSYLLSHSLTVPHGPGLHNIGIVSTAQEHETYAYLIPLTRAMIEIYRDQLKMTDFLPDLPTTDTSPTFFEDFQNYCRKGEWRTYMQKQVGSV